MFAKIFAILAIIGMASASGYSSLGYGGLGYSGLGYGGLGYSGLGSGGLGYSSLGYGGLGYSGLGYGGIASHGLVAPAVATSYSNSYTAPAIRSYGYGAGYGAHGARLGW